MKFGFSAWHLPTPKSVKRFGYALATAGTAGAGIAYIADYQQLAIICAACVFIGTFAQKLFGEQDAETTS